MKYIINFIKKLLGISVSETKDAELENIVSSYHDEYINPFVISIKNTSDKKQKAILFGSENDKSIQIKNVVNETDIAKYTDITKDLDCERILIGKWRFDSKDKYNLIEPIFIINKDANEYIKKTPLKLSELLDSYQYQSNVRESKQEAFIDDETTIEIEMQPNSKLNISMYTKSIQKNPTNTNDK